jgi:hypothetical protein
MIKQWVKSILPLYIALVLAFVMAIVLVVLAVMGYLGKGKVEEIEILQVMMSTATTTATTNAASAAAITNWVAKTSSGMKPGGDIGRVLGETVLCWIFVCVVVVETFSSRLKIFYGGRNEIHRTW